MGALAESAKGVAWTTVSAVTRSAVSLLQVSILTRILDKGDFGIVAIANLFIGFTQIFLDLGLSSGILHKQDITARQYSSLFWVNILTGLLLTFFLCLCTPIIARFYKEPSLVRILSFLSLTVFFSSLGSQHRTVQQKMMRFKTMAIIEISASVATIVSAVWLAKSGFGVYSLVYSTMLNALLSNLLFLIVGLYNDRNIAFHLSFRETVPFLKIGIYSVGSQVLDYFSREIDVMIISAMLGKEKLGVYSLCKKLITALYSTINPIINKVLTPFLAKLQDDKNKIRDVYFTVTESMGLLNFPIYFSIALFAQPILFFLYGEAYTSSSVVLAILALYYGYISTGNPVGSLQIALGRTDSGFYWTICRIVLYSFATYVGSFFQVEGIVFSLFLISLLSSPISWKITIEPLIGGKFFPFFWLTFKPFLMTLVIAAPFYLVVHQFVAIPMIVLFECLFLALYSLVCFNLFKNNQFVSLLRSKIPFLAPARHV